MLSRAGATTATALTDYRGLASARPVLAGLFTLFLLAQAGVPFTGGFVAKLSVFSAAIDVGSTGSPWSAWSRPSSVRSCTCASSSRCTRRRGSGDSRRPSHRRRRGTGVALTIAAGAIVFFGSRAGHHARLRPRRHPTPRPLTRNSFTNPKTQPTVVRLFGAQRPFSSHICWWRYPR